MIAIMFAAVLGGAATFAAWSSHGILLALALAPFGGSVAGSIVSLTIAAKNPE
jgi:hypothetical protein